jgi:CRP-like cAMP-binding protein
MYNAAIQLAFQPFPLDPEKHPEVFAHWQEVQFPKGALITEAGHTERFLYIVLSGVQMLYLLTPAGEKQVIGFSFDGSFSGVYDSFLKERPSHYFVEALTASELIRISKEHYDAFFSFYPEMNVWGRIAHGEILIGRVQREVELITMSAQQRFEVFIRRCPEPLKQIPQKYLASYLNMSPETFSRLRARIS